MSRFKHDEYGIPWEDCRIYPPLSADARLLLWREKVDQNSRRFPRPRSMFLRQKLVEAIGLPDNVVVLDQSGDLWHASRSEPIARANAS